METPKHKPHTNIGSFLTPDQKDHVDKILEFLKTDNLTVSQQIKKLEADKAELLEALERCNNELHFYSGYTDMVKEIEYLIQKYKK